MCYIESESHSIASDSLWPMDYRVHGILQARILEWIAFPFSLGSFQPRHQTEVSRKAGRFLPAEPQGKLVLLNFRYSFKLFKKINPSGEGFFCFVCLFNFPLFQYQWWTLYQLNQDVSLWGQISIFFKSFSTFNVHRNNLRILIKSRFW